jgi:hypothetical protein
VGGWGQSGMTQAHQLTLLLVAVHPPAPPWLHYHQLYCWAAVLAALQGSVGEGGVPRVCAQWGV